MFGETLTLSPETAPVTFSKLLRPSANVLAEYVMEGSSRTEPTSVQFNVVRQGSAKEPVLRFVKSFRNVRFVSDLGKTLPLTYVTSLYLPIYADAFTSQDCQFLARLDGSFTFQDITAGAEVETSGKFDQWILG